MSVLLLQIKGQLNLWLGVHKDHYMIIFAYGQWDSLVSSTVNGACSCIMDD